MARSRFSRSPECRGDLPHRVARKDTRCGIDFADFGSGNIARDNATKSTPADDGIEHRSGRSDLQRTIQSIRHCVATNRVDGVTVSRRSFLVATAITLPLASSAIFSADSLAALTVPVNPTNKLSATRVWPASEYTRVTFEAKAPFKFQHFFVKDPERLVLDIENIELGEALKTLAAKVGNDDPYIKSVRVGINRPNVVRVVLDLKAEVLPQVFAVPPAGEFGHRLMLDIYPAKPADPMLALLNEDTAVFGHGNVENQSVAAVPNVAVDPPGLASKTNSGGPLKPTAPVIAARSSDTLSVAADNKAGTATSSTAANMDRTPRKPEAPAIIAGKKPQRPFVVVLDPGHGGEDPGAVGKKGTREKDIVLTISRQLKEKLDDDPRFRTALTRDGDFFVPLHHRVQRARRLKADLFVSVHADAFIHPQATWQPLTSHHVLTAQIQKSRWLAGE